MLSWTLQPYIMQISEKRVPKTKVRASVDTAELGALAWGGSRPPPRAHSHPFLHTVSPHRQLGGKAQWKAHSLCGQERTRDLSLVIPVPHSSWNLNANLRAAATEPSVIKRIKKHLYCDYASCQNVSWHRKWKQPLCSIYRNLFLNIAKLLYV